MKKFLALPLAFCLTTCNCAHSLPQSSSAKIALSSVLDVPPTQSTTIGFVRGKLGQEISSSQLSSGLSPGQDAVAWLEAHRPQEATDKTANLRFVGESLQLSQQLLKPANDERMRREGFLLACETAAYAGAWLREEEYKTLQADIYSSFILPNLALGNIEPWQNPSRQRLLEASSFAFARAAQPKQQQRVLEWLLQLGEAKSSARKNEVKKNVTTKNDSLVTTRVSPSLSSALPTTALSNTAPLLASIDLNTLMWARGTLAASLMKSPNASRADLQRAMTLLKQVKTTEEGGSMSGFVHLRYLLSERLQRDEIVATGTNFRFPYKK